MATADLPIETTQREVSYRRIVAIALPIALGGMAQNLISVTNTAFLARVGPEALSASALGSILFFVFSILGLALGTGTQILVARRVGEGRDAEVGRTVDQAIYIQLSLALISFLGLRFGIEPLSILLSPDPAVRAAIVEYIQWRAWEIFPALLFWSARGFYTGVGWTTVVIYATATMATVNILGDWLLVFGNWGFPRMGIAGAAMSSTLAESLGIGIMVVTMYLRRYVRRFGLFRFPPVDWQLIRDQLTLSGPLIAQNLISIIAWFLFFWSIGMYMGTIQLAAANVVRSLYMVALIPAWAFGSAGNSLISNVIGQGRRRLVLLVARRATIIASGVCLALGLPIILFPTAILTLFAADPAVVAAAIPNLPVVMVALLVAGAGICLLQAVMGTGATGFAFRAEVVMITIYIVYLFTATLVFRWPQPAIWVCEILYFGFMALLCGWYLQRGTWRKLTV